MNNQPQTIVMNREERNLKLVTGGTKSCFIEHVSSIVSL